MKPTVILTEDDQNRLRPLLLAALEEGEDALRPGAIVRPDDPAELEESVAWAKLLLTRFETGDAVLDIDIAAIKVQTDYCLNTDPTRSAAADEAADAEALAASLKE